MRNSKDLEVVQIDHYQEYAENVYDQEIIVPSSSGSDLR